MKIVDRKTFLTMPNGTVFAKFSPHVFEAPQIKADTCGEDYVVNDMIPMFKGWEDCQSQIAVIEDMLGGKSSPPFDYDSYGRDGLFDQEQLFAVFERPDVEALIGTLRDALARGYPNSRQIADP